MRVTTQATALALLCSLALSLSRRHGFVPERESSESSSVVEFDAPRLDRGEHFVVFGDSKDWFVWTEWCASLGYRVSRACKERPVECSSYEHTDMLCVTEKGEPIVAMWMFYGVALHPPYFFRYETSHSIPHVPTDSIERLEYLLKFTRDEFNMEKFVLFSSCAWDAERLVQLNQAFDKVDWLKNASTVISSLQRNNVSSLVLRTSQDVRRHPDLTRSLNEAMLELSETMGLPLLNTSACLEGMDEQKRLRDETHPTPAAAVRIAYCASLLAAALHYY